MAVRGASAMALVGSKRMSIRNISAPLRLGFVGSRALSSIASIASFHASRGPSAAPLSMGGGLRSVGLGQVRNLHSSPKMSNEAWDNDNSMGEIPEDKSQPRLFVGNLPWSVDSATLGEVFEDHGKVLECTVMFDRNTGRSRGFAFVTFETMESAESAKAALDGQMIGGRALRVNFPLQRAAVNSARPQGPMREFDGPGAGRANFPDGTRCYVGNLAWSTDSKAIGDVATQFGTVMDARVVVDKESGRSRGFAFVAFETAEEADAACQGMDGMEVDGRMIRCRIATP